jgi:hypothetical protein
MFERNYHRGFDAWIGADELAGHENIVFWIPPIKFCTHDMAMIGGWTVRARQRRWCTRPHISFTQDEGFGFRIRLKSGYYKDLHEVFRQVNTEYRFVKSDSGLIRTQHIGGPFAPTAVEVLAKDNDEALKRLGDWRPQRPPLRIVDIEQFMQRGKRQPTPVDIGLLISKIAS